VHPVRSAITTTAELRVDFLPRSHAGTEGSVNNERDSAAGACFCCPIRFLHPITRRITRLLYDPILITSTRLDDPDMRVQSNAGKWLRSIMIG